MGSERRREARSRVLRRGRIVFRDGFSAVDCVVLDISASGARLRMEQWFGVPDAFMLRLDDGRDFQAEVRYRGFDVTGVRFVPEGV